MGLIHLLPLLIILGGSYGIYRKAKRTPPATAGEFAGVGGWLMFLVIGLTVLWPFFCVGSVASIIEEAQKAAPHLAGSTPWERFKSLSWWLVLGTTALSIYAGYGLAKGRSRRVVTRAIVVLWTNGPLAAFIQGVAIPLASMGTSLPWLDVTKEIAISCIATAVWTAYLVKSKRVTATYSVEPARLGAAESAMAG